MLIKIAGRWINPEAVQALSNEWTHHGQRGVTVTFVNNGGYVDLLDVNEDAVAEAINNAIDNTSIKPLDLFS